MNKVYQVLLQNIGGSIWKEELTLDACDPLNCAKTMLAKFNNSKRGTEKIRSLVFIRTKDAKRSYVHIFDKKSLVTEKGGYDRMACSICGVTGKRYGLNSFTEIDKKYKHNKYKDCAWFVNKH